jgi:hypothetical protein
LNTGVLEPAVAAVLHIIGGPHVPKPGGCQRGAAPGGLCFLCVASGKKAAHWHVHMASIAISNVTVAVGCLEALLLFEHGIQQLNSCSASRHRVEILLAPVHAGSHVVYLLVLHWLWPGQSWLASWQGAAG